jgi:hypothetical protein
VSSAPPVQIPTLEAPAAKGGCLRAGLIGCGAVALILVLAFVGVVLYAKKNPTFMVDFAMSQIESNFGPDVTETDKLELKTAVADFKAAIRSGKVGSDRSSGLQRSFNMRGRSSSGKLSHEDVQDLIRTFKEAAGREPAPVPTFAPAPSPSP